MQPRPKPISTGSQAPATTGRGSPLPVLKRLGEYLREQKGLASPKSQFVKAITDSLNQ